MASSFHLDFPGTSADFVVNANKAITHQGGIFKGNTQTGTFSIKTPIGAVKGTYNVLDSLEDKTKVAITITQKPLLVPISKIQQVIQGYF
jgi:hypothetical protein